MKDYNTTIVGLDTSKKWIVSAVLASGAAEPNESATLMNTEDALASYVRRVVARHGPATFVYEAGPCGYALHRQLVNLGQKSVVIAPSLTPRRPGDRVKTDRRDAEKLARLYRAGELTSIRVPSLAEEAARDLVRTREDALADRLRARHRLGKFLLRQGRLYGGKTAWTQAHRAWLRSQRFEEEALRQTFEAYARSLEEAEARLETLNRQIQDLSQTELYRIPVQWLRSLRGLDTLGAMTLAVEVQEFSRFDRARSFMGYTGLVVSERTTGLNPRRGGITKTGNAHIRRILVEAAWSYRRGGVMSPALAERRKGCPSPVVQIAKEAQVRLHRKFWRMAGRGKSLQVSVVAVARELAGFVWSISRHFPSATV